MIEEGRIFLCAFQVMHYFQTVKRIYLLVTVVSYKALNLCTCMSFEEDISLRAIRKHARLYIDRYITKLCKNYFTSSF